MELSPRKNWLVIVTCVSVTLNVIGALVLYQNSKTAVDSHQNDLVKQLPLDYESFRDQWGRAWLGLEVTDVTLEMAARADLDRAEGAYVKAVAVGSPAQKADIVSGDIIISFNGRKIRSAKQFQNDMLGSEVGSEVYMCVAKDDYRVTVYALPEQRLEPVSKSFPWLGVKVTELVLGSDDAKKIEEAGKEGGVLVEEVIPNSPAEQGGLQVHDVIMSFDSRKTRTLREFLTDLAGAEVGQQIRICIIRDDIRKTLYVTLATTPQFISI